MTTKALTVDQQFDAWLAKGEFRIQRCSDCARSVFYPRVLCPACGSARLAWHEHSGRGVVYSTTVIRRPPEKGGDSNLALIDLEGGARMMSRVVGMPPDEVSIDLEVAAEILVEDGQPLVVFRPRRAALA